MKFQFYDELPQEAHMIREKVFVEEQGFQNEFDDIDQTCLHMVVYDDYEPIGCARMFPENNQMILGRIAVLKEHRSKHIGSAILQALEQKAVELHYKEVVLSAQLQASEFYMKNGYMKYGNEYFDEFCPHVHMKKQLAELF